MGYFSHRTGQALHRQRNGTRLTGGKDITNSDVSPADCPASAIPPTYVEKSYDDFDAQSEQLSGYDQEYFQMSRGAFRGRFVSAVAGPEISMHLETTNQALEQKVGCPAGMISLGLVVGKGHRFEANGMDLTEERLLVTQPGCEMNLKSPAGGSILAVCLDREMFLRRFDACRVPELVDGTRNRLEVVDAPVLARQIRMSAIGVLNTLRQSECESVQMDLGEPLISAISAQFALHDAILQQHPNDAPNETYQTYNQAKRLMLDESMQALDYAFLSSSLRRSRRSIQLAFARHAEMSPSNFHRTLRLSRVRRALASVSQENLSIGDIAAQHGFWSWSQFTQLYKLQFGELPSATRARLGGSGFR